MPKYRSRRTVPIVELVKDANHMLLHSDDSRKEGRKAVALFITNVLIKHKRYNGYNFLTKEDMLRNQSRGTTVGINDANLPDPERFADTDDTRRYYY